MGMAFLKKRRSVPPHLRGMRPNPTNTKDTLMLRQTQTLHTFNQNSKLFL